MPFDKIIVLGAGVVGSAIGGFLSQKHDVLLVTGNRERAEALNSQGLIVKTTSEDTPEKTFKVKALPSLEEIPKNALILLTTKATQSRKALQQVKRLQGAGSVGGVSILVLQNGLNTEKIAKEVLPEANIARGIVNFGSMFVKQAQIELSLSGSAEITLQESEISREFCEMLADTGISVEISRDFQKDLWSKLVMNCVVNPISAILNVRNFELGSESLKNLRHAIIDECSKVAAAEGITLDAKMKDYTPKFNNFSSMCQDMQRGKKTEIDFLNGKVVELGKKHSIPTPVNEMLVSIIKFLEEKNASNGN